MKVFAPGKLVLTGAYAVLEGAPSIVVATSRGAVADASRVNPSPTLEVAAALGEAETAPHVDASALFVGSRKLGLGASAAILVASLAAREAEGGASLVDPVVRARLFARGREAHAKAQSGGSGVDVAASVYGGALRYVPGEPAPVALPAGLLLTVFACATSARTADLREVIDRFAEARPAEHRARLDDLGVIARAASAAVDRADAVAFVEAVREAARGLDRLGRASGASIVPDGFEELEAEASSQGSAFCVSGAGGGDVAVYLGPSRPSGAFFARAHALGLFSLDLDLDEKGVRIATPATPPSRARAYPNA